MKKIVLASLISVSSLMAMYGEQAYLYKDNRIMGAGGANVAVGGYSTSIFYNPAGLRSIKKEHGFVVDLLGLQVSASEKFNDFSTDLTDAMDSDDDAALIDVLEKYDGEHFHANVSNYSAISKNSDIFAWSVGLLVGADVNYMTHSAGSANAESLETTSRGYGGVLLGIAKDYDTAVGKFDIGLGLKFVTQKSYEGLIPLSDLIQADDIVTLLEDKYEQESSGYGVDIGVIYHPFPSNTWHPTIGLSILNIGDMSMDDNYGAQPMTVNLGLAISPEVEWISSLTVAVDFVDLLNANKVRVYTYNPEDDSAYNYIEADNDGLEKKIRAGVTAGIIDSTYFSLALSGGWYQSSYTAGVDMELTLLKLSFATYEEDLGYGAAELTDRRYTLQLGLGW